MHTQKHTNIKIRKDSNKIQRQRLKPVTVRIRISIDSIDIIVQKTVVNFLCQFLPAVIAVSCLGVAIRP